MWRKEGFDSIRDVWYRREAVGKDTLWKSMNYYSKINSGASLHFEVDYYYTHYYDGKVAVEIWCLEWRFSINNTHTASSRHNGARHISNLSSRHWMTVQSPIDFINSWMHYCLEWDNNNERMLSYCTYVCDAELRRDETRKFYRIQQQKLVLWVSKEREREFVYVYVQPSRSRPVSIMNWYRMLLAMYNTVIAWERKKRCKRDRIESCVSLSTRTYFMCVRVSAGKKETWFSISFWIIAVSTFACIQQQ